MKISELLSGCEPKRVEEAYHQEDIIAHRQLNQQREMVLHSPYSSADSSQESLKNDGLAERERVIQDLQVELIARDRLINQQRIQLDEAIKNLSVANKTKSFLTNQLAEQDRKLTLIEKRWDPTPVMREDLHVAHEALTSLRKSFRQNDPQHHTLDTIEQSISLLMERLHLAEMQIAVIAETAGNQLKNSPNRGLLSLPYSSTACNNSQIYPLTKVVYFTDKGSTPCMTTISKRLGDITLGDFKAMLGHQPGDYHYYFKSMDPEFGIVKEEILHDGDILPGVDGKIISWVEGGSE